MTALKYIIVVVVTIFASMAGAQNQNKVVVIPLGGQELTEQQEDVLDFFSYDAANDRLTISGTAQNPLNEVFFQGVNVRGASVVRQDFSTNAPDIPSSSVLVEIEEENITLGSAPNSNQAVVVHAFANIDTDAAVNCPCEFRAYIVQDEGLSSELFSEPSHLEVEAGDGDIDATISHTFAFIATSQTQNYSFQVQVFAQQGAPGGGVYRVDEAGISISTFGLASLGVLDIAPLGGAGNSPNRVDLAPEAE